MARAEIEPQLPYIQVHRSVAQKAAMLAPLLCATYQHVRGSMDCFWEALADRRLLTGLDRIVLPPAACRARLRLAFGMEVDPELLVTVGFLELEPGGYRVRGMSRYIAAELSRQKRSKGAGTVRDATNPAAGSNPGPTVPAPGSDPGPTPHAPGSDPAKARGERREYRDERREERGEEAGKAPPAPLELHVELDAVDPVAATGALRLTPEALKQAADRRAPDSPLRQKPSPSLPIDGLTLRDRITAAWLAKRGTTYGWVLRNRGREGDDDHSRAVLGLANGDEAEVLARWFRALNRKGFPTCGGLKDLATHWNYYGTDEPARAVVGRATEADKDWSTKPATRMTEFGEEVDFG